ncbi:type II secretion system protein GspL [Clostridium grantii]|uniref:Type IV pilus assembly protein PilM n=1 Tax=Clostridium grantii DSM 8605 TaxID=1121316 RepID=A0A1M5RJQ6_9CLOT|nr:pilus assembly protein PilM [Clostridium grantii]SHH26023.1 type IV pilus assembly protein PilM [Clostridium grantii DSM 8605]
MGNLFSSKVLSMEFGTKSVKMLEMKASGKGLVVSRSFILDLDEDMVKDGNIENKEELEGLLKSALDTNRFTAKKVDITIKSSGVIVRNIFLPKGNVKDMDTMIKYEIEEQLPVNVDDYEIKYKILGEKQVNEEILNTVNIILFPKKIAQDYWDLMHELELRPKSLNLNFNSIEKIFNTKYIKINKENSVSEETFVVIDIGYKNIEVNIISQGLTQFSRIISGGGKFLDDIISGEIRGYGNNLEVYKLERMNLMANRDKLDSAVADIIDMVKVEVERWIKDIDRVLDYYINENRGKKIEQIYIHGGTSNMIGLPEYMEMFLNASVSRVEIKNIKSSDLKFIKNSEKFINVIGATIR